MEAFSRIAAEGERPQNAERDLHRYLQSDMRVKLDAIRLPLKFMARRTKSKKLPTGLRPSTIWADWPVVAIWQLFALFLQTGRFFDLLHSDADQTRRFWQDFRAQAYSANHSIHSVPEESLGAPAVISMSCLWRSLLPVCLTGSFQPFKPL